MTHLPPWDRRGVVERGPGLIRSGALASGAMKLSARNQLTATVTGINKGAAIANVEHDVFRFYRIVP